MPQPFGLRPWALSENRGVVSRVDFFFFDKPSFTNPLSEGLSHARKVPGMAHYSDMGLDDPLSVSQLDAWLTIGRPRKPGRETIRTQPCAAL